MAQVIVRRLDDGVVQALKRRAANRGHSLEQELRDILAEAARPGRAELRACAAAMRARYQDRPQTDSALLLREDRDR